jgi:proteasome lid subunit RPN8/RPN11
VTTLRVGRTVLDEIGRHARSVYPREAVGLAGGPSAYHLTRAYPLTNIAADSREFLADPFEHWKALNQIREDGLIVCAAYHSHPDGGVGLSDKDRAFANSSQLIQVVVSVANAQLALAAYVFSRNGFHPVPCEEVSD